MTWQNAKQIDSLFFEVTAYLQKNLAQETIMEKRNLKINKFYI